MCLRTNTKNIKVAKEDLTFYKVLIVAPDGTLKTPHTTKSVELNTLFEERDQDNFHFMEAFDCYEVSEGGIHLFVDKEDADWEVERLNKYFKHNLKVFEATVPKGTKYVKGEYGCEGYKSVAVKKVIYKEI